MGITNQPPAFFFVKMFDLVYNNNFARPTFPDRLLLGIFWEETFFNNIHQYGLGSGVGFGQVEPAEFWKLKEYGLVLPVYTVQRKNSKGETYKKTYAARALTDVESVKATAGALMFLKKKLAVQACLEGYGGVQWARDHPQERPTAAERLQIIEGWKACAVALEPCRPYRRPTRAEEDQILDALAKAKGFKDRREEFRRALFRSQDYQ